jgi:serine/threonine-protein kinase
VTAPLDIDADDPFDLCGVTIEDKYRVDSVVGAGGFGVVYRGEHSGFGEPIAVKCLKLPADLSKRDRDDLLAKLQEEGRVLHRLSKLSSSIVQALDVGAVVAPNGKWIPYLILEWLEGETLAAHLAARRGAGRGTFSLAEALELLEPAARALEVAHRQRVAHRDVKPENLYLAEVAGVRTLKVLDFGIAKVLTTASAFTAAPAATQKHGTAFTPSYGAPEQFNKKRGATGPWTDVFALALIVVELVSGERALSGDDATQLYIAAADPASRPTLRYQGVETTDAIEDVLCRALAVDPSERYQDAGAFWDALRAAARKPLRRDPAQLDVSATGEFVSRHEIDVDPDDLSAVPPQAGKKKVASPTRKEGSAPPPSEPPEHHAAGAADDGEDDKTTRRRAAIAPKEAARGGEARKEERAVARRPARPEAEPAKGRDRRPAVTETQTPPAASGRWMPVVVLLALAGAGALALQLRNIEPPPVDTLPSSGSSSATPTPSGNRVTPRPSGMLPANSGSNVADAGATEVDAGPDAGPDTGAGGGGGTAYTPPGGMVFIGAGGAVAEAFFIDATEVTSGAFKACIAAGSCGSADEVVLTPEGAQALDIEGLDENYAKSWVKRCTATGDKGDHPINCVPLRDAAAYCKWRDGKRLPKVAEWQLAATGAGQRKFPWGDEPPSCSSACIDLEGSCFLSQEVATCAAGTRAQDRTGGGILDLAGNVAEWTADGSVIGGSFLSSAARLMSTTKVPTTTAIVSIGFRCALTAPEGYAPP